MGRVNSGIPVRLLSAAGDTYARGFHKGNSGGLDAIDTDLATANIKSGVTVFGKAGSTDVRDSTDADLSAAEAPTGKTFYAGGGAKKTGTGTKTLSPANETVAAGYYAATTLSAVDGDLAPANIKNGVTIFGKVGTVIERPDWTAADTALQNSNDTLKSSDETVYTKKKETRLDDAFIGTMRIVFDFRSQTAGQQVAAKIYRNGVALGTERLTTLDTFTTYSEDFGPISWAVNDLIQVYCKRNGTGSFVVQNFRFYYTIPGIDTTNIL